MNRRAITRISLSVSILAWIALVITDLTLLFSKSNDITTGIGDFVPLLFAAIYVLSLFWFFKSRIDKTDNVNFVDLLWKVFVTGLLTTIASLSLKSLEYIIGKLAENPFVIHLFYLINLTLAASFIISTFMVWRRLILYQKSKLLLRASKFYEYGLLFSLILEFLPAEIYNAIYAPLLTILILLGLFISVNMKWVAYLNFKQKWKSILLILLIILYLGYFYITITSGYQENPYISNYYHNSIFLISLFIFVFLYAFFSVLVILFNLPTSSVFEQKLDEVVNYQRLSQSIQTEKNEDKVYEILLDSSVSTAFADAGWIELDEVNKDLDEEGFDDENHANYKRTTFYKYGITDVEIDEIKNNLKKHKVKGVLDFNSTDKNINYNKFLSGLKHSHYNSLLAHPIVVQNQHIGTMVLLKDVSEGFNKEMSEITKTFVTQAGISIENFRLLQNALENERYQEELKIAKKVQQSLLPVELDCNKDFDIIAFSNSADEVGGDYYDTYRINDERMALIIGDVSGKGTSAAFQMSQLKGTFQSLSQMDLSPSGFLEYSNMALSRGLEKTSFVTASYFVIDSGRKVVEFARAGHCPTLYYRKSENAAKYYENKGLGLGILRNKDFNLYLEQSELEYKSGDVLVIYTDGITEANNFKKEEYGYDRLKDIVEKNAEKSIAEIRESLISDVYKFTEETDLNDDYTAVFIKFK